MCLCSSTSINDFIRRFNCFSKLVYSCFISLKGYTRNSISRITIKFFDRHFFFIVISIQNVFLLWIITFANSNSYYNSVGFRSLITSLFTSSMIFVIYVWIDSHWQEIIPDKTSVSNSIAGDAFLTRKGISSSFRLISLLSCGLKIFESEFLIFSFFVIIIKNDYVILMVFFIIVLRIYSIHRNNMVIF